PGTPNSSSGAATSINNKCCAMCALNKYWSASVSKGETSAKNSTASPMKNAAIRHAVHARGSRPTAERLHSAHPYSASSPRHPITTDGSQSQPIEAQGMPGGCGAGKQGCYLPCAAPNKDYHEAMADASEWP